MTFDYKKTQHEAANCAVDCTAAALDGWREGLAYSVGHAAFELGDDHCVYVSVEVRKVPVSDNRPKNLNSSSKVARPG